MPGYDIERFVNLSQNEKLELICSICQDVLRDPVVTKCCLQTFCEQCINDWLKTNKTCPYDRKTLTSSQLTKPPRAMMNMLSKLNIRCDFRDKGCKEVLALENLSAHSQKCKFNNENKRCKICDCDSVKASHDCVKYLLECNKKLGTELNQLKKSHEAMAKKLEIKTSSKSPTNTDSLLMKEVEELKKEKLQYLKTIAEISKSSPVKPKLAPLPPSLPSTSSSFSSSNLFTVSPNTTFTASSPISEQEIFIEARKYLHSNSKVSQTEMTKPMTTQITAIVNSQVREYNSMFEVCRNIVEKLNSEYGTRWHCTVSYNQNANSFFSYESGFLIKLLYGKLAFEIYKTQFLNVKVLRQRFVEKKIKREIKVLRADMRESMIYDLTQFTFSALEKCESLTDISSHIKQQMELKYSNGQQWHCFMFAYFGNYAINHSIGKFISYDIGELTITVFQTNA